MSHTAPNTRLRLALARIIAQWRDARAIDLMVWAVTLSGTEARRTDVALGALTANEAASRRLQDEEAQRHG